MSTRNQTFSITLTAGADLSSSQYLFVGATGAVIGTLGAASLGVLANNPDASGKAMTVDYMGVTKVKAGAAITAGAKITPMASGKAQTAGSGHHVAGYALEAATADGDIISAILISQHILA